MPFPTTRPRAAAASARTRIYRYLYEAREFTSRQTLTEQCGISMPTLHQNLTELIDDGLVRYSGEERPTGGRKARGIEIVPDARIAVGISITENHIRYSAVDLRMKELAYRALPVVISSRMDTAADILAENLESFLDDYQLDRNRLLGIGIALPGMFTRDRSRIFMAPPLSLHDVPVERLTGKIPYPVYLDNDASCSGNLEFFKRRGTRNLSYLLLENGVGGALILGGRLYNGSNGRSAEFGHMCVEFGGRQCSCGKRGCLEAYCTTRRITEDRGVSLPEFFQAVEEHDPECEAILYDILRHLAIGINNIHMALDCSIVLGGILTRYLQPYLPILRRYVLAGNPFETSADFVHLSSLPRHIAPLGAALHFILDYIAEI